MRFLWQNFVSKSFLVYLRYFAVIFFFPLRLFDGVCFQYFQVHVIFLFPKRSDSLIWQLYSFRYLSFVIFHYEYGIFYYGKFHSNILVVYSYCLYRGVRFFFNFFFFSFIFIIISLLESFSNQHLLVVFQWNLNDNKFSLVSMTLLSILA